MESWGLSVVVVVDQVGVDKLGAVVCAGDADDVVVHVAVVVEVAVAVDVDVDVEVEILCDLVEVGQTGVRGQGAVEGVMLNKPVMLHVDGAGTGTGTGVVAVGGGALA